MIHQSEMSLKWKNIFARSFAISVAVQVRAGIAMIRNIWSVMDLQRVAKSHLLKSILGLLRKSRKQNQIFRYRIFACLILGVLQMNGVLADTTRWWSTGKKGRRIEACPWKKQVQKRTEKYWQEHAEEKKQYDARTVAINAEITDLKGKIDQYDSKISEIRKDFPEQLLSL